MGSAQDYLLCKSLKRQPMRMLQQPNANKQQTRKGAQMLAALAASTQMLAALAASILITGLIQMCFNDNTMLQLFYIEILQEGWTPPLSSL